MPSPQHKHNKEPLLNSVADFIGSTLGTIASKANEIQDDVSHSSLVRTATREGKSLVRRSRTVARKIGNSTPKKLKTRKLAKAARRKLLAAKTAARRVVRPSSTRKRHARSARAKK
jgi:hypothetical protein